MELRIKVRVLLLLVLGLGVGVQAEATESKKVVEAYKVQKEDIAHTIRLIGTLKAKRSSTLVAKTQGVLDRAALPGQAMKKGEMIAKLENQQTHHNVELARHNAEIAKAQYERLLGLLETGHVSKQTVEVKKHQWLEAQKLLNDSIVSGDKSRFIAPFNGVVGAFKVREGGQVQEGDMIVTFFDPSEVIIELDIPGPEVSNITTDTKVQVQGTTHKLDHIQHMIDPETQMAPASFHYPCTQCVIGQTISVDVILAEHQNTLVIPFEAIFLRNGNPNVYVIENNKAELRSIETGVRDKERIEILNGLNEAEVIIPRGHGRLYPGEEVRLAATTSKEK